MIIHDGTWLVPVAGVGMFILFALFMLHIRQILLLPIILMILTLDGGYWLWSKLTGKPYNKDWMS